MAQVDSLSFANVPLSALQTIPVATYSGVLTVDYGQPASVTGTLQVSLDNVPNIPNLTSLNFTNFTIVRIPKTPTSSAIYEITGTATIFGQQVTLEIAYKGKTPHLVNSFLRVDGVVVATGKNGDVSSMPVCFGPGTRIRVVRSRGIEDVEVENLVVGDLAVTASGAPRPISWLGHRTIDCRRHPNPTAALPVRVTANAFGKGLPVRDLLLSPGHPVLVNADDDNEGGHLVPIMCLINGTTIDRVAVDEVTYWHVELNAHDILLAEGLPAESYLDWGDRAFFSEGSDHALHNPDFVVPGLTGRCRPVKVDGPVVETERRRLDAVFAAHLIEACEWPDPEPTALGF